MIDFVFEVSLEHWGVVEEIGPNHLTIFRDNWAPGMWAGVKNVEYSIKQSGGNFYKCSILVTHCDLEERTLHFKCNPDGHNIEPGDTLHYMKRIKV